MPGRHPDDDLLADLAADVLPADQARGVEAHVLACDRCAGLLENAERVRSLLVSADPGPVPPEVWHRIEAALAAEASSGPRSAAAAVPPAGADGGGDGSAPQSLVDAPGARSVVPLPAPRENASGESSSDGDSPGWADDADPLDDPVRWSGRPARSGGSRAVRTRRDAHPAGSRRGRSLLVVAAAVAVIGLVGSVRLLASNDTSASLSAGGAAQSSAADSESNAGGGAPAQAPGSGTGAPRPLIVRSGRDYHASKLAAEGAALLAVTTGASGPGVAGGASSDSPATPDAAQSLSRAPAPEVPADPAANDITNPARLAACLDALGVARDRVVAVDLATYEGREAAVLLLQPAEGGGHEVWAVERTCAPGAEGALKYSRLSD